MKKGNRLVVWGVILVFLFALAGCGQSKPPAAEKKEGQQQAAKKTYKISFFVKTPANPFYTEVRKGANKAAEELGNVQITHLGPTKSADIEESVRIIEDVLTKHKAGQVDALILVPTDFRAFVPVVKKANEAKLPVINFCSELLAGGEYVSFIGLEEEQLAYDIAKYIIEKLGGKGDVVIIEGQVGSVPGELRLKGFKKALAENPNVKLLASQPADFNRAKAMQVMENLQQQFPKIDAVLGANDETALGAIRALENAGRLKGTMVSGVDATKDGCEAVKSGKMTVTLDYMGFQQGYVSVKTAVDYLEGKSVTKRNLLKPVIVDAKNIDQVIAQKSKLWE